jgi:hypothetical protein
MFDLKVSFSFKSVDIGNWIGVIFRKKDDFNFYCVDVSKEWIRIRRMLNGK